MLQKSNTKIGMYRLLRPTSLNRNKDLPLQQGPKVRFGSPSACLYSYGKKCLLTIMSNGETRGFITSYNKNYTDNVPNLTLDFAKKHIMSDEYLSKPTIVNMSVYEKIYINKVYLFRSKPTIVEFIEEINN